jgi:mRNA interferase RelE/StbE
MFAQLRRSDWGWLAARGDYRLIVKIEDDRLVVLVLRVGHRKEVYR